MLTVVLLIVLGGGAGLVVVALSDRETLSARRGRSGPASLRSADTGHTAGVAPDEPAATRPPTDRPAPSHRASGPPATATVSLPEATARVTAGPAPLPHLDAASGRSRRRAMPSAFTAIEGPWHLVATAPWWRRGLSAVALIVVLGGVGVAIAGVAGALIAFAAQALDGAVG